MAFHFKDSGSRGILSSKGSFQNYMQAINDHHHEQQYAHPHHVMHRIKPSMLKRSDTDWTFDQREAAAKSGQKLKHKTRKASLPTIADEDEEHQREKKRFHLRSS